MSCEFGDNSVAHFIKKTYDILQVCRTRLRTITVRRSYTGYPQENNFPSKIYSSSSNKFCPCTSDTATSTPSSDNSTCTVSTNPERISPKTFSAIKTFKREEKIFYLSFEERLKHKRKARKTTPAKFHNKKSPKQ